MGTRRIGRVVVTALVLTVAAIVVAPSIGGTGRPYHGWIDFTSAPAVNQAPCAATEVRVDANIVDGVATHLGTLSSVEYYACLDPATLAFHGRFVWAAANGDTIHGPFGGRFVDTGDHVHLNIADASFAIDGGTGRFAGATGGGTAGGSGTLASGHLFFDGTISY
jgi:hypothetical protein